MVKEYGYEYNATINEGILSLTGWSGTDEKWFGAYALRSGRDALKVIAREYSNSIVYLPSLCCDSMITPFETYGCKIVFYPLKKDLTVDFSALLNKLESINGQKLILFYDYFLIPMFCEEELIALKRTFRDLIFIKDITHSLLQEKSSEFCVDYTIASLRKWLAIPDGGLLWENRKLKNTVFLEDATFAEKRLRAQCMRTEYFVSANEKVKEQYRQIFSSVSSLLDNQPEPVKMSAYSYDVSIHANWKAVRQRRAENARILMSIFSQNKKITIINEKVTESALYLPILIKNRDEVQRKLSAKGIFNTIIWPLREEQTLVCPTAKLVTECMLAVPCDQRYDREDMVYIGNEITRMVHE